MPRKPDQSVRWSKRENSLLYHYEGQKPTSMLIAHLFEGVKMKALYGDYQGRVKQEGDERTFAQELDARGYDLTTLKFSIYKKPVPGTHVKVPGGLELLVVDKERP